MSIRVMSLVWDGYPGGGTELLAILALSDWSDDEGRCWPSMASIAGKIRLSEKQARRVVHSIIEAGYLIVTENALGGATSRRYQINLNRLVTPPTHGSPPVNETPPMDVPNPSHGREPTPPTHGSRTVIDTSITVRHTPRARKTIPPEDFSISTRVRAWAAEKGFDRLEEHLEVFKAKCAAKGYTYADHDAAFMEAVRQDWGKLRAPAFGKKRKTQPENFASRDYGKGGLL